MNKICLVIFIFVAQILADEIYASFDVVADKSSALAFKTIGVVSRINADVGDVVKKGDLIIELENERERLGVQMAKSDLNFAKIALEHAQNTYEKFKQVQGVTSKQSFDDVSFELKKARAAYEKSEIALKIANQNLADKALVAPYDAIVVKKSIELGEGVGGVAQKVIEIISNADVKLILSFDEKFKDRVKVGDEFKFSLNGETKSAKISLIYPTIERKNQKITAEAYSQNITPGLFGEGVIVVK